MKFYIPNTCLSEVEDQDCVWLKPVVFNRTRKALILDQWANGWLFEADESFNSFFTVITGNQLPTVSDAEYAQLEMDRISFLSKERTRQFGLAWNKFHRKINN